jgi:hypothetical protein
VDQTVVKRKGQIIKCSKFGGVHMQMKSAQILRNLFFDPTVNDDIQVAEDLAVLDPSKSNLCIGDFCNC